ncbi:MAG: hypothetical protein WDA75_16190 [Candidatus Latescibacterota bacterium]
MAARFTAAGISGPGIEQTVELVLQYFPGDGEAVVRTEVRLAGDGADLLEGQSRLGQARVSAGGVVIDYSAAPLAGVVADTVSLRLTARTGVAALIWEVEIRSTADSGAQPAHAAQVVLSVVPPLWVEVSGSPVQLYAGERALVRLTVRNADPRGRQVEAVEWEIPPPLRGTEGPGVVRLGPLVAGAADTLVLPVAVDPGALGPVILRGRVRGEGLSDSPVPEVAVRIDPVPSLQVQATPEPLEVGQMGSLTCVWRDIDSIPAGLQAVQLELGPTFEAVEVVAASAGRTAVHPVSGGGTRIEVEGLEELAAAESVAVALRLRPTRPGPWVLKGWALPGDRTSPVPLGAGGSRVRVVLPASRGSVGDQPVSARPNDLELFAEGLSTALAEVVGTMALPVGERVVVRPDGKTERNWLVEEALAKALMDRGYGVQLAVPGAAAVLCYRVTEARVIYGPPARGWRFWQARQSREASGDLFLRLERVSGEVLWAAQARPRGGDRIPAGEAPALAAGDAVARATVTADSRWLERGLSACIVGGLFYIFFVL